jgi:hypothetical protein
MEKIEKTDTILGTLETNNAFVIFSVKFLTFLYSISTAIAILMLINTGINLISSKGNVAALKKAKEKIKKILLGLCLILCSWLIIYYIIGFN